MRYNLFLYSDENLSAAMSSEQQQQAMSAFEAYIQALNKAGVFVTTDWLKPTSTATTIRVRDGKRQVQDGPYASTKEQLAGFFVLNVKNLDEAMNWAAQCPMAAYGHIELRPSMMG